MTSDEPEHAGMNGHSLPAHTGATGVLHAYRRGLPHAECPKAMPCLGYCGRLTTTHETIAGATAPRMLSGGRVT
jgi:hypothetical protein